MQHFQSIIALSFFCNLLIFCCFNAANLEIRFRLHLLPVKSGISEHQQCTGSYLIQLTVKVFCGHKCSIKKLVFKVIGKDYDLDLQLQIEMKTDQPSFSAKQLWRIICTLYVNTVAMIMCLLNLELSLLSFALANTEILAILVIPLTY